MSTQLYRIARRGAQLRRWEWPNGEVVRGPRTELDNGRYVPVKKHGGPAQLVTYGAPRVERITGRSVPDVRSEIRLTAEGAKALAHMGLVPVTGGGVILPAGVTVGDGDNGQEDTKAGEPDPTVKVPGGWRDLSESKQRGLAAKISGTPKAELTAEQAAAIIEAHLAAGGSNSG
jgi:hypothetical protein